MALAHLAGTGVGPQGWAFRNEADGAAQTAALVMFRHVFLPNGVVTPDPRSKINLPATSQRLHRRLEISSFLS
jgi:hypothetical protein